MLTLILLRQIPDRAIASGGDGTDLYAQDGAAVLAIGGSANAEFTRSVDFVSATDTLRAALDGRVYFDTGDLAGNVEILVEVARTGGGQTRGELLIGTGIQSSRNAIGPSKSWFRPNNNTLFSDPYTAGEVKTHWPRHQ